MNTEQAKQALGLDVSASAEEALAALKQKRDQVEEKIASAPTDALKAKFEPVREQFDEVEAALKSSGTTAPRSPLTETKMADLPGAARMGSQGDDSSAQQLHLNPGDTLAGRYQIKEQIGSGGMGAVYRAADSNTGKDIALKVLLPALLKHERARERFMDEARISQQLSHPNIVNVYDVQNDGDFYFLTMELLEGQDLRQVMENRKLARQPFAIDEVQEIIKAVSEALTYAHKHTVHRDIKPENIWLNEEGEYKLMDFGIARLQSTSQRTQTGAAMGTAYYMAPEQLKGAKDVDGRADQYALAVLSYELLTGEVPAGMIEPIGEHRKDVPKGMAAAIHQALSPRPENRFSDMSEFVTAIVQKRKARNRSSFTWKRLGVAALVLLFMALGIAAYSQYENRIQTVVLDNSSPYEGYTYEGRLKDGLPEGEGSLTHPEQGYTYVGGFNNGLFHGQGKITHGDGGSYVGKFKDGRYHGRGTLIMPDGSSYVGEFKDGFFHGEGTRKDVDGSIYVGEFENSMMHGKGTVKFAEGFSYVGGFKNDKLHGHGDLTFQDGSTYVGGFKEGLFQGQGTRKYADGSSYVGGFKSDKFHGKGTRRFANGAVYIGEFKDGKYHGEGALTAASGIKNVGMYQNGKFTAGKVYESDGRLSYSGTVKDNGSYGTGIYYFPNGDRFEGEYKDAQNSEWGTYVYKNGQIKKARIVNNNLAFK